MTELSVAITIMAVEFSTRESCVEDDDVTVGSSMIICVVPEVFRAEPDPVPSGLVVKREATESLVS